MAAEVPAVPDEIVKAIQERVPAELARYALPQHAQGEPDDGRLYYPYGATVGQAVTVMTWGDKFLTATLPSANLLEPLGQGFWLAPILADGKAVGTVELQYLDDGTLSTVYNDNHAVGAELQRLGVGDVVGFDGPNGVFVFTGDEVRQPRMASPTVVVSVLDFQGAILERVANYQAELKARNADVLLGAMAVDLADYAVRHGSDYRLEPIGASGVAPAVSSGMWIAIVFGAIGFGFVVVLVLTLRRRMRAA